MQGHHSNSQLILGASYLLVNERLRAAKLSFWQAAVKHGLSLLEIGFFPIEDRHTYWQAFEQALKASAGYILLLDQQASYTDNVPGWLKQEIDHLVRLRKPALIFLEDAPTVRELFQKLNTGHYPNLQPHFWSNSTDLAQQIDQALKRFQEQNHETSPPAEHPAFSPAEDPNDEGLYRHSVYFQGFYYSAKQLRVKPYWLQIGQDPVKVGSTTYYPVREWKFHDAYSQPGQAFIDQVYAGWAHCHSDHLHVDLAKVKDTKDLLRLRLFLGNMSPNALHHSDILLGSIHGLTSLGDTNNFAYKTILVGTPEREAEIGKELRRHVERILNISRKSFLTRHTKYSYTESNHYPIEDGTVYLAEHIAGTYRIWTEGHQSGKDLVQSKMEIQPNLEVRVYNGAFKPREAQVGEIYYSRLMNGKEKLIFVMRLHNPHTGARDIVSVAMMEFPKEENMDKPMIGSFCSAGRGGNERARKHQVDSEVRGGYFVVRRDDFSPFEPGIISYESIDFEQDLQLQQMREMLRKANRIRTPRKESASGGGYVVRKKPKDGPRKR